MRENGLLVARHTGKRPPLAHEGKVITLRSNLRWCRDGFEIPCWNGQVVRVAFALDCCDVKSSVMLPPPAALPAKWWGIS